MKKIRLESSYYKEANRVCSLTICLGEGRKCFQNAAFSQKSISILKGFCEPENIELLAYCFMPDHAHFLVKTLPGADILLFVRKFKSITSKLARSSFNDGHIWQRRFYDHFLRSDESINMAAEYVLNNPVRKGLVTHWKEYPFCGTSFDI